MTLRSKSVVWMGVLLATVALSCFRVAVGQRISASENPADGVKEETPSDASEAILQLAGKVNKAMQQLRQGFRGTEDRELAERQRALTRKFSKVYLLTEDDPEIAKDIAARLSIPKSLAEIDEVLDLRSRSSRRGRFDEMPGHAKEMLTQQIGAIENVLEAYLSDLTPGALEEAQAGFREAVEANLGGTESSNRIAQLESVKSIGESLYDYATASSDYREYAQQEDGAQEDGLHPLSGLAEEEIERCLERLKESNTAANREALTDVLASVLEVMGAEGERADVQLAAEDAGSETSDTGGVTLGELSRHLQQVQTTILSAGGGGGGVLEQNELSHRYARLQATSNVLDYCVSVLGSDWQGVSGDARALSKLNRALDAFDSEEIKESAAAGNRYLSNLIALVNGVLSEALPRAVVDTAGRFIQAIEENADELESDNRLIQLDGVQRIHSSLNAYSETVDKYEKWLQSDGVGDVPADVAPLVMSEYARREVSARLGSLINRESEGHRRDLREALANAHELLAPALRATGYAGAASLTDPFAQPTEPTGWTFYTPYRQPNGPSGGQVAQIQSLTEALRDAPDAERDEAKARLRAALTEYFETDLRRREEDLAKIEQRVAKLRDQLQRRREKQEEIVELQLEIAVNEAEGLGFFPAEGVGGARSEDQYARERAELRERVIRSGPYSPEVMRRIWENLQERREQRSEQ